MAADKGKAGASEGAKPHAHVVQIETLLRVEFKDITNLLQGLIAESGVQSGVCHLFVPHTTAGILINENDDPALQRDLTDFLKQLAPQDRIYHHNDGNCDSHLKAAIIGAAKTLLIENARLVLGRWQGVYFCEFDGPRRRDLRVKIVSD
ncbi:MAG: secondary thiamine-phosphate synthase enzyme YjbQ [Terriglobia bacterium]